MPADSDRPKPDRSNSKRLRGASSSLPEDPALARFLHDDLGVGGGEPAAAPPSWCFTGPVWLWRGSGKGDADAPPPKAAWYFLTIDGDVAASIRAATRNKTGGFGSVRVTATIGKTSWQTSLFPSKDSGGYLLPLKASVRRSEGLGEGVNADVEIKLAD